MSSHDSRDLGARRRTEPLRRLALASLATLLAALGCDGSKSAPKSGEPTKPAATTGDAPSATAPGSTTNGAKSAQALGGASTAKTAEATPKVEPDDAPLKPFVDDGKPCYEVTPPNFSLGVLDPSQKVTQEITLKNVSERPFSIAYVTSECKCLVYDFERGMIAPGKSAKVTAKLTATTGGAKTTAITLHLSDPARSKVRIAFDYVIVPEILLEPKLVDLGRIETGQTAEQEVKVTLHLPDQEAQDPVVEPFVAHDVPVELKLDPPTISPSRHGIRDWVAKLHVKLHSAKAVPAFTSTIVFTPKNKRDFRGTEIPLHGEVITSFYFERQSLGFGTVEVGKPESRDIRYFFPAGGETPKVLELSCDKPEFTATYTTDVEHHCFVITVTCLATKAGSLESKVKMQTSLAPEESDSLRVTARAR
jgi:hypothetical protein